MEYAYDHAGRMTNMTTWQNFNEGTGQGTSGSATTTWVYDSTRGWLNQKTCADGTGPTYTYTPAGRLASRAWARGIATWYTNNNAGELSVVNYSDATPDVTYGYDRRGRQTSVAANGSTMTRSLTDAGLVLSESFSGGTLNGLAVTNGFDSLLRRSAVGMNTQPSTLTQFGYDGASRLQNVTNGSLRATYSYLANSPLVAQVTFATNSTPLMTTTKSYDYVNRLTGIGSSGSGFQTVNFNYGYNSASQRTGVTNADSSKWVYTYDSMGQVTSGRKYFSDGTPVAGQQFDYAFDDIGNRQTTARDTRTASYTNNLLNQITGRTVLGYVNVLGTATNTATVTVNNQATARKADYYRTELGVLNGSVPVWLAVTNIAVLNQGANPDIVASVTGNVFVARSPEVCGYDADGNMTNDGRWVFTWDAENRLKQVESRSDAPSLSRRKVVWEFDGQGRRIRQTTYDGGSGSYVVAEDLKFLSDGWAHIAELNATNNALVRSYAWGLDLSGSQSGAGGVGGLLIVNSTANGAHFCAYDGNGNVAALVKATDGSETARYEYGPFGEVIRATGTMAKENPFRFSTKRTDNTTDFVLYEYRLYSPSMGRWLSRDPAEAASINCFAFSSNEPMGGTDYLGLWDQGVHHDGTKRWALEVGFSQAAAERVAFADNDVDSRYSYITEPGTQYHFNRSFSMGTGGDSRMIKYKEHFGQAKAACTSSISFDAPELAALQLGTALHPLQDWMAHGDHNYFLKGNFKLSPKYIHNYMSPEQGSTSFPDDPDRDAFGVDGRPDLNVLKLVPYDGNTFDYALYIRGQDRVRKTHSMTDAALKEFREHVRVNGGCKCKKYFGLSN